MIRIALVEDDPAYAEQLTSYLREYEKESKERISVQTFSDGEDIVTEYRADYDIILMDVDTGIPGGCFGLCVKAGFLFCIYTADRSCTDETEKERKEISDDRSKGRYDETGSFGNLLCGGAGS